MTLDEFRDRTSRYKRQVQRYNLVSLLSLALWGLGATAWSPWAGAADPTRIRVLAFVPALFVFALTSSLWQRAAIRRSRLHCPRCGTFLGRWSAVVIASKHCGECGERVINSA